MGTPLRQFLRLGTYRSLARDLFHAGPLLIVDDAERKWCIRLANSATGGKVVNLCPTGARIQV